jgi:hypothetical protein
MCRQFVYLTFTVATMALSMGPSLAHGHVDLIGHWRLDETSGATAADHAGGDNDGILFGDLEWAPGDGILGGALSYLGATKTYVTFPTTHMSAMEGTVSLWGNLSEPQPEQEEHRYFFGHTTIPEWTNRIQLYMNSNDTELDLGLGDDHHRRTGIVTLDTETWYHIALTWDAGDYVVYVNGQEAARGTYTGLTILNTEAHIGNNGNESFRGQSFGGLLDEVRIYNGPLSDDEIRELASPSPYPIQLLEELALTVLEMNLQGGISNSLGAKLDAALNALRDVNENNDVVAANVLGAFINAVEAQRGKKITNGQADTLIAEAEYIIDLLLAG